LFNTELSTPNTSTKASLYFSISVIIFSIL
jgi:hypothetical protein